ncbi:MAG: elongation factor P [Erysipelotrichaceae bacterium]|nr:elongation factor P [Erysipelotrichaceae bacterium]
MAIEAGDFKTGLTVMVDGDPWVVIDFMHVKPGKGAAILKTKMKNLKTGNTLERNFNASTKFEAANIEKRKASFSYSSDGTYYFMDSESYDTYELSEEQLDFKKYFILEGMEVMMVFFEGNVLDINLPDKVEVTLVECENAVKGDTATNALKNAVTETGLKVKVPMFIEEGERITVFTADGKYAGRA